MLNLEKKSQKHLCKLHASIAASPSASFVVWLLSKVVGCVRRLVVKIKEPANNHVSILEEPLLARRGPLRTSQSLN